MWESGGGEDENMGAEGMQRELLRNVMEGGQLPKVTGLSYQCWLVAELH